MLIILPFFLTLFTLRDCPPMPFTKFEERSVKFEAKPGEILTSHFTFQTFVATARFLNSLSDEFG
jgi:hypothetical protein